MRRKTTSPFKTACMPQVPTSKRPKRQILNRGTFKKTNLERDKNPSKTGIHKKQKEKNQLPPGKRANRKGLVPRGTRPRESPRMFHVEQKQKMAQGIGRRTQKTSAAKNARFSKSSPPKNFQTKKDRRRPSEKMFHVEQKKKSPKRIGEKKSTSFLQKTTPKTNSRISKRG